MISQVFSLQRVTYIFSYDLRIAIALEVKGVIQGLLAGGELRQGGADGGRLAARRRRMQPRDLLNLAEFGQQFWDGMAEAAPAEFALQQTAEG